MEFIRNKFTNRNYGQLTQSIIPFQNRLNFFRGPASPTVTIQPTGLHQTICEIMQRKLASIQYQFKHQEEFISQTT